MLLPLFSHTHPLLQHEVSPVGYHPPRTTPLHVLPIGLCYNDCSSNSSLNGLQSCRKRLFQHGPSIPASSLLQCGFLVVYCICVKSFLVSRMGIYSTAVLPRQSWDNLLHHNLLWGISAPALDHLLLHVCRACLGVWVCWDLFSLENRRLRKPSAIPRNTWCKENRDRLCSKVSSNRTTEYRHKLNYRKFHLNMCCLKGGKKIRENPRQPLEVENSDFQKNLQIHSLKDTKAKGHSWWN